MLNDNTHRSLPPATTPAGMPLACVQVAYPGLNLV
jgi:hypothetical protein